MTVLQKESPQDIIREATEKASRQAAQVVRIAYNKTEMFKELTESIRKSGILRATSRFIVGKHIEKPFLNGITAKGRYEDVLDLVDVSQKAYLTLVERLIAGAHKETAQKDFAGVVLFKPSAGGEPVTLASMRMPDLTELELRGVLQSQEAAFFRMASEVDERVLEQYRGTHG
jgi:hypothetical protein